MTSQNKKTPRAVKIDFQIYEANGSFTLGEKFDSIVFECHDKVLNEKLMDELSVMPWNRATGTIKIIFPITIKPSPDNQEPNPPLPMKNPKKFRARKGKGRR